MSEDAVDTLVLFEQQIEANERANAKYHRHEWNRDGASNPLGCNHLRGLRKIGFVLPPLSEFKKQSRQVFSLGHLMHGDIQEAVKKQLAMDPTLQAEDEVFFEVTIPGMNLIIESYIDIAYFTKSPYNVVKVVRNVNGEEVEVKQITEEGYRNLRQICDIKSESDYAFGDAWEGKFSANNMGQFHLYMYAMQKRAIEIVAIRKSDNHKIRHIVRWDDDTWQYVIQYNAQYIQTLNTYLPVRNRPHYELPLLDPINYGCINTDGIDWWSCPLSQCDTYMKTYPKHKETQTLVDVCPQAREIILRLIPTRFQVGQIWYRSEPKKRKASVEILAITDKHIQCRHVVKRGEALEHTDELVWAYLHYSLSEAEE